METNNHVVWRRPLLAAVILLMAVMLGMFCFLAGANSARAREAENWEIRFQERIHQIEQLEQQLADAKANAGQPAPTDERTEKMRKSLLARTDLIGDGVLGGTMRFYPEEFCFFGQDLAYAYAEDGHVFIELLLRYTEDTDEWTVLARSSGGGNWYMEE